ncbi:GTPase HflX [Halovivax gelatinilyticus]|uniref:GTPase HflX n=1 Tax=Halovivax gelatinilyticus TaxID=2961597 RepID=UPI0020CA61A7|nr:GTPase HflX [Halovivax gelatinilyticus]
MTRKSARRSTQTNGQTAIVATLAEYAPVETDEIEALTEAAGYTVAGTCTQRRRADPGTKLGDGKVDELAEQIERNGADLVVVDGELTPTQSTSLRSRLPADTRVFDRYRLILEIFGERARRPRARQQVELARLRYELPRIREAADEGMLNRRTEKGSPLYDVRDRIDRLERKLESSPSPAERYRTRRREEGFDLVTLAGYTNAGKSTLLHRLADDLAVDSAAPDHPDEDGVATIEDRLFETLETTTRRATIDGRPTLVTDTVGFVQDIPHDLVRSFSETLSEAGAADVVVLVVDATDEIESIREKVEVSLDVLSHQGVGEESIVTALNKIDAVSETRKDALTEAVSAPSPIPISAVDGTNVQSVREALVRRLPTESDSFTVAQCDESMRTLSWLYDAAVVESVAYDASEMDIEVRGRPSVIDRARAELEESET